MAAGSPGTAARKDGSSGLARQSQACRAQAGRLGTQQGSSKTDTSPQAPSARPGLSLPTPHPLRGQERLGPTQSPSPSCAVFGGVTGKRWVSNQTRWCFTGHSYPL